MDRDQISIFWFRRDLRIEDNAGLFHALHSGFPVLPLFIFDTNILSELNNKRDRRVDFIHQVLSMIDSRLKENKSSLLTCFDTPVNAFEKLIETYDIQDVYCNHDYEPYAIERDKQIHELLNMHHIRFHTYKDQVIFEKNEVSKDNGEPYTVFTPYSKKWKAKLANMTIDAFASENKFNYYQFSASVHSLESLGFAPTAIRFKAPELPSKALLEDYSKDRDFPYRNGTTHLSMHLRFGTISIRKLVQFTLDKSEVWLNELIWREFYMMILYHFPHAVTGCFKRQYDGIQWENDPDQFKRWCEGKTGFPIVDAGMRELNETGFMHNRLRMIVSSFLVKDLQIDWRWGEAYFAEKLNDFDLSANNGGWQWAAGTGCDAAPYFRIFNPTEQQKKFDPEFKYIRKWVKEFGTPAYPAAIVDHSQARIKTLELYKRNVN